MKKLGRDESNFLDECAKYLTTVEDEEILKACKAIEDMCNKRASEAAYGEDLDIARNLIDSGQFTSEAIARWTKLPVETVDKLKAEKGA